MRPWEQHAVSTERLATHAVPGLYFSFVTLLFWKDAGEIGLAALAANAWLAFAFATIFAAKDSRLQGPGGAIWAIALFLAGAGALTLVHLATGSDNTRWYPLAQKHLTVLAVFGWMFPVACLVPEEWIDDLAFSDVRFWKNIRIAAVICAFFILLLHLAVGTEGGLGLFQPSELSKLLVIVASAFVGMHIADMRHLASDNYESKPLSHLYGFFTALALLFLAVAVVLYGVNDLSPVVILVGFALFWLWKISPHPEEIRFGHCGKKRKRARRLARTVVIAVLVGIVLFGTWMYGNPENIPDWVRQKDRLMVWAAPELHPHSGMQVLRSFQHVAAGKWTGQLFRWETDNTDILETLPMVQNDFIGKLRHLQIRRPGGHAAGRRPGNVRDPDGRYGKTKMRRGFFGTAKETVRRSGRRFDDFRLRVHAGHPMDHLVVQCLGSSPGHGPAHDRVFRRQQPPGLFRHARLADHRHVGTTEQIIREIGSCTRQPRRRPKTCEKSKVSV